MQDVLHFLFDTLFSLLFFVFLLRLLLQWVRADFRNPLSQAILRLTNWLIMPLRRVLPPIGRIDTASVVAVLAIALAQVAALYLVRGLGLPDGFEWLRLAATEIARTVLWIYFWSIFVYAMLSLIAPGADSPASSILHALCEPLLGRIRSIVPSVGGLDLSPLWAGLMIQVLLILLH
jgi:YggT family protein